MPAGVGTLLGSAAASIGGSVVGAIAGSANQQKAQDAMNAAYAQITAIGAPPDMAQAIIRQNLQQVGVYTPALEQNISDDVSKVAQIQEDPSLRSAQTQALSSLQQQGQTGLTASDRAAFNQNRDAAAQQAQSQRQQVIQGLAQRGMSGSGAEIAAQLGASQSGDQALAKEGDALAAAASQNALQATAQAGSLGGQIRSQDFSNNQTKAAAQDALNQFNINNQIAMQQRNVQNSNTAQQQNLATAQGISNANINAANQEQLRELQGQETNWQNQMGLAQSKANALTGQAQYNQQQGQKTANTIAGIGQGVGSAINAYGAQQTQNNFLSKLLGGSAGNYGSGTNPATNASASQYAPITAPNVKFGQSIDGDEE